MYCATIVQGEMMSEYDTPILAAVQQAGNGLNVPCVCMRELLRIIDVGEGL